MLTRKRTAAVAAICVFAAGMIGFYFFVGAIKDKYSDITAYVIVMIAFGVVCGLAHLTERMIYEPPDKPPFDPSRN